jgi:hypothetical protein
MSADTNSVQDSPITFNAFKQNFDSNDEKDRYIRPEPMRNPSDCHKRSRMLSAPRKAHRSCSLIRSPLAHLPVASFGWLGIA